MDVGDAVGGEEGEAWYSGSSVSDLIEESLSEDGSARDGGGGGGGVAGRKRELPITEESSLADIRKFVRDYQMTHKVKTSGPGRTKAAIFKDVAAVWLGEH